MAVQAAQEGGAKVLFNFPNDRSRPGYEKMGWRIIAPMQHWLVAGPCRNYNGKSRVLARDLNPTSECGVYSRTEHSFSQGTAGELFQWRFMERPDAKYEFFRTGHMVWAAREHGGFCLAARVMSDCSPLGETLLRQVTWRRRPALWRTLGTPAWVGRAAPFFPLSARLERSACLAMRALEEPDELDLNVPRRWDLSLLDADTF